MDSRIPTGALRLNERAATIADAMVADADALRISATRLEGGARLVDCGVVAPGGLEAGRLLAEACLGGAGQVAFTALDFEGLYLPGVLVRTDHPALACLASQYAGWAVKPEGYFAMGSGPLRAVARVEQELFRRLGYAEPATGPGVLVLETRELPGAAVGSWLEGKSGLAADRLTLLVAPTAATAASVQISARVVETALHKLLELGFDVARVQSAFGTAPIAPVARNDLRAIGRTNDCVLYGGFVHLTVTGEDAELAALVPRVPSSASRDHGTPFHELFQRYGGDFYKVDPLLFSPARVAVTNATSGRTFEAGRIDAAVLKRSLLA
jgi:methenyltetrahydromethanopterin cyclohydrolase